MDYVLEDALHARFAEHCVAGTEWFRLTSSLLAFIRQCVVQPAPTILGGSEHEAMWEDLGRSPCAPADHSPN
ncbi:hypothetical protein [Streptomyces spiralis]|uniref:hypothetical protein n=1 Tax=Streptomyces spiralis TaxID=66376 RepID=UPI0034050B04